MTSTVEVITQKIHPVDRDKKHLLLAHLIKERNWFQVLVFTRTKHGANKLVEQLGKSGISALAIHGNKSQAARTRALSEFKSAKLQALVATDIAARGIDIDQLPHVVNYDLPNVPEDYVHRIGRTGRAGATGEAVSLVCVDEHGLLRDIERFIKREVPREVVEGFEPDPTAKPQPIQLRSQDHRNGPPRGGQPRSGGGQRGQRSGTAKPAGGRPAPGNRPAQGQGQGQGARSPQAPRPAQAAQAPARPAGARPVQRGGALLSQPAANAQARKQRSGEN